MSWQEATVVPVKMAVDDEGNPTSHLLLRVSIAEGTFEGKKFNAATDAGSGALIISFEGGGPQFAVQLNDIMNAIGEAGLHLLEAT